MAHGHNPAITTQHGIEPPETGELPPGVRPGIAFQPPAGRLVEIEGHTTMVPVRLAAAIVEQAEERPLRNAALLHAHAGVRAETIEVNRFHAALPRVPALRRRWDKDTGGGGSGRELSTFASPPGAEGGSRAPPGARASALRVEGGSPGGREIIRAWIRIHLPLIIERKSHVVLRQARRRRARADEVIPITRALQPVLEAVVFREAVGGMEVIHHEKRSARQTRFRHVCE